MPNSKDNENNLNIESALLGLIFVSKKIDDKLSQIFVFLDKTYFSNEKNQTMFEIFKSFYDENIKEFDYDFVDQYIEKKTLSKIIDHEYLDDLLNKAGYVNLLNTYLTSIIENNRKKKLKDTLESTLKVIKNSDSNNLIESIREDLFKIEDKKLASDFLKGSDVAEKVITDTFANKKEIKGLKTGFSKLDEITTGFQNGDLIIIAARPSVGKTAFALNLALNIMMLSNKTVAFFSLEMPAEHLIKRMLASISNINNYKFKEPDRLTKEDKERILLAYEKFKTKQLFIDDSGSIKLDEII